jgi:hypothetical protein
MSIEAPEVTITVPKVEWDAHVKRVESLVDLITGVMNGLSSNPLLMSMVPPDTLNQMRAKL